MVEILSLYSPIPNSHKKLFESRVVCKEYRKGDYLLLNNEVQDTLFLVRSGLTMMYSDNNDKKKVIDFAYKNRFSADVDSFCNQIQSIHCIECIEDCSVEHITYDHLMELLDNSREIERAYRILTEKILTAVLKRHLELSSLSIEERFHQLVKKKHELFGLVQHKYIASYLNIDPTNFSKLYNQFIKNPIKFY